MKDLRSNFQGFNNAEEDEQEEEQYGEEEYIEEDDYVRVEGTEDEEGLGDTANEGQRYSEENQEEEEDNQNQDYQEEEEDYEPEDQGNSESQNQLAEPQYPPQIIEEETPEATPKVEILENKRVLKTIFNRQILRLLLKENFLLQWQRLFHQLEQLV